MEHFRQSIGNWMVTNSVIAVVWRFVVLIIVSDTFVNLFGEAAKVLVVLHLELIIVSA